MAVLSSKKAQDWKNASDRWQGVRTAECDVARHARHAVWRMPYAVRVLSVASGLDVPDADLAISTSAGQLLTRLIPGDGRDYVLLRDTASHSRAIFAMP